MKACEVFSTTQEFHSSFVRYTIFFVFVSTKCEIIASKKIVLKLFCISYIVFNCMKYATQFELFLTVGSLKSLSDHLHVHYMQGCPDG